MMHLSFRLIAPFAAVAAFAAAPAAASDQDKTVSRPAQIDALYACRDIADPAARLGCFDREVGALSAAEEKREISFADKAAVEKARRGLFGFSLSSLGSLFGGGDDDSQRIDRIETTLRSVGYVGTKYRFTLEDGAVWQQTDTIDPSRQPRAGDKIEIKAGAMGSFMAKVEGGRAMRVHRER